MKRLDRDAFWFNLAAQYATRATCPRAQVGTLLVKFDRLIGAGVNGAPDGEPHCLEDGETLAEHLALEHCLRARHSERNAVRNALLPPHGATAYVVGPRRVCPDCDDVFRSVGITDIRHRYGVPSLDALTADIRAWQAETFPDATPESVAEHLRREAEELAGEPTNPEEIADIFHLLVAAAEANGYDLIDVVATKFVINKNRRWGQPDEMGCVEHVRGGS